MTRSIIYTVADGKLNEMSPAAPENEDTMQQLVADFPEIIADRDGALLLVRREQSIADRENGGGRWSIDHLFVTREAVPVLVELKRATDTRLRREVVGQILDYAANASVYWKAGELAASFEATAGSKGRIPEELLAEFHAGDQDSEAFWLQVEANLRAGRMKLVFVADVIPPELARIVEFLNEQMRADVRAVELSWFEGSGIKAFTPRIIGETERAQATKAASSGTALLPISRQEWIEKNLSPIGPHVVAAANIFCQLVEQAGGTAFVPKTQGSITAEFSLGQRRIYPFMLSYTGKGLISLSLSYLKAHAAFAEEAARQALYDELVSVVGPLTTKTLNGFPAFLAIHLNEPTVQAGFLSFLERFSGPPSSRPSPLQ